MAALRASPDESLNDAVDQPLDLEHPALNSNGNGEQPSPQESSQSQQQQHNEGRPSSPQENAQSRKRGRAAASSVSKRKLVHVVVDNLEDVLIKNRVR
eukprot:gene13558-19429_t